MREIESIKDFELYLQSNRSLLGVVFQGLDLRLYTAQLLTHELSGAVFLGCSLEPVALEAALRAQALVFPKLTGLPYGPYRAKLYRPEELYRGFSSKDPDSYAHTPDAQIYQHWKKQGGVHASSIVETLAQRLHDHAVTDALEEFLTKRKVVALMGGHSMRRGSAEYRSAAWISRALSRGGFCMASGGGPGAMEATHLGAYLAHLGEAQLEEALTILAAAPTYKDSGWLGQAFEVRALFPPDPEERFPSLGIPTWHYGHEPPNPFASHIAKYFANSVREEGLLTIATYGVIFTPGSAGTIQEIFQDACQNHYNSAGVVSPMVFFGEAYWKWQKPVFPLLSQLAVGNEYGRYLSITDDPQQVVSAIEGYARIIKRSPD